MYQVGSQWGYEALRVWVEKNMAEKVNRAIYMASVALSMCNLYIYIYICVCICIYINIRRASGPRRGEITVINCLIGVYPLL